MSRNVSGLVKFLGGSAMGATIGAVIGALMAPRSGDQLQAETAAFLDHVKAEGEAARVQAEQQVAANFRARVSDPDALKNA